MSSSWTFPFTEILSSTTVLHRFHTIIWRISNSFEYTRTHVHEIGRKRKKNVHGEGGKIKKIGGDGHYEETSATSVFVETTRPLVIFRWSFNDAWVDDAFRNESIRPARSSTIFPVCVRSPDRPRCERATLNNKSTNQLTGKRNESKRESRKRSNRGRNREEKWSLSLVEVSSVLSCEEDHVYLNESKANVGLLDFYITHVRTCFRLYFFFFF